MAETTVFPGQTHEEAAPPAPKGRPRKDGLPAGTEIPRVTAMNENEFFLALANYDPKQWDSLAVYVYRLKPITDRQSKGEAKYICKYGQALDIDQLMRDHGSGYYQLRLIQSGTGPRSGGQEVARTHIDIVNMEYPPKLAAGDWVDDPRNRDWMWCRDKLAPLPTAPGQTTPAQLVDAVLKMQQANQAPRQDVSILAALAPLLDPQRQTDMMLAFASLLPKPAPPAEPKEDKSLALMLQMLMDDRKAMREEMSEVRRQANTAPAAQKSWIETAIENEELMRRLFGKGNGPSGPQLDGWAAVIDKGLDKIGGVLTPIAPIIAQRLLMAQPPQQRPATVVQATAQPQPLPAPEPAQAQPQPEAAPQEAPQDVNQLQLFQKYGQVIQQALPFMIDQFKEDEPDGYGCRDWFCSPKRFGNVVWEGLRNDVGVEQFITVAKGIPQVWQAFQPEDKFRAFLTDFFTSVGQERADYFEEDFEEEPDEDETRPGAKTNAGK